jgi:hypothetical protein
MFAGLAREEQDAMVERFCQARRGGFGVFEEVERWR